MNRQEYLKCVRKEIHYIFDRDAVERELSQHMEESMEELHADGLSWEEAEAQAVEQMGDAKSVGHMLNQVHKPVLGYLWMLSNLLLVIVAIPAVYMLLMVGWGYTKMLTPTHLENSVATYSLKIELEVPTHKVVVDNICIDDSGDYAITYRAWTNYRYSRSGMSSQFFYLENSAGEAINAGGWDKTSYIGRYGYMDFEKPEDGIVHLVCSNGETIVIDLEEYCDEKG